MIAEAALGAICILQAVLQYKLLQDWRSERTLLQNRALAHSTPELVALQIATKPTRHEWVQTIKNGHVPEKEDAEAKRPSLPFGL